MKNRLPQKNYGTCERNVQLLIDESFAEKVISADDSVRLLDRIVEEMDLSKLLRAYDVRGRKPATEPSTMLKVVAYANMEGISGDFQGSKQLLRISDILRLRPCDIVSDGGRYRLAITEQKTGKQRVFTVPLVIEQYIENYCLRNGISRNDHIFPISARAIQKQLAIVCEYLGYEGISTHSFRKWYASEIYRNNGYDIALVQRLLQHSSAAVTQRYIGIEPQRIERAIEGHAELI